MDRRGRRLASELKRYQKDPLPGCTVECDDDDITTWIVSIKGPPDTPYANGTFQVSMDFPEQYPFKPPNVKFITKIHHPNVKKDTGEICNAVFSEDWGPTLNARHCLQILSGLLLKPDADNPFDEAVAQQMMDHPDAFKEEAKKYTKLHAM
eukprot:CAMPEP_0178957260 /NCGR_PEP_ID=MMETSP0789-20121207/10791_1 /TAXON_ID=3005 /ORGANISM="Rhizosolenia setigera, Strain CCMP 1694" /LENGTH=150 /DNA_ID=CAMNT_0020639441 /DNA_START=55 /DNA_END=507 /DNA_ORIENTATION=-